MIKRVLTYVNLGIFLLSVLGYYGIMSGMKELSGARMGKRLNSGMYDLGGNITIKVPLSLPFEVTSAHFEQEGGEFEMDGEVFRIIKQRHYNDTLYVVCIRDEHSTRINSALNDFAQSFAGQDDGDGQQVAVGFYKEYAREEIRLTSEVSGWAKDIQLTAHTDILFDSYFASIVHPPERSIAPSTL